MTEAHETKKVVKVTQDPPGYLIELSCNHTVWCAVNPGSTMYCGECLSTIVEEAHAHRASTE